MPVNDQHVSSSSLTLDETHILIQFREWVLSQKQIVNPIVETRYLTRFLRARGFDLTEACETYKKFVKMRDIYPHCYKRLDIVDPAIHDLMTRGYLFPLWERDAFGRTVIFGRGAMFNQKHGHRPTDLFRSIMMTVETLLDDEENQRNGFVYIFDQEGVCLSEVTYLGVFEMQKLVRSGEKALPIKHKEVHWLNLPPIIMTCFYLISSFLSEKLRKRLFLHKNLDSLHESIPRKILPLEYGGIVPWRQMSQRWISALEANRCKLLAMDKMRWDDHKAGVKPQHTVSLFQTLRKSLSI